MRREGRGHSGRSEAAAEQINLPLNVKCQLGLEAAGTINGGLTTGWILLEAPVRVADGLARVVLGHRNQRNVKLENPSKHYF